MSQKKGNFIIKGAAGTVKLGGLVVLTNSAPQARWRDVTDVMLHTDSAGVLATLTRDFIALECTYRIIPGKGDAPATIASKAAAAAAVTGIRKGDQFISTGFDLPELNCADATKAIIMDIGGDQAEGAEGGVDVTVRKFTTTAGTVIDLTGAWANL
jgi:hypothetical protein